ncbi:MAG: 50S ribosomal protein L35 [Dehalococcoidia bacterium]|nr:50S ribosomal protein L35 [Dehalococcoidia bacterium]
MPKLKTHKGTAARFRATSGGKGKLMRMYHGRGHFKRNKRGPVKVLFGRTVPVSKTDSARIKALLEGKN